MDIGIYCLNVGQGNCLAVIDSLPKGRPSQSQASLIDVGTDGDQLADWFGSIGVRRIPLIALTHNDADHICGLPTLVQRYRRRIGRVLFLIDRNPADIPFFLDAEELGGDRNHRGSWATRNVTPLPPRDGRAARPGATDQLPVALRVSDDAPDGSSRSGGGCGRTASGTRSERYERRYPPGPTSEFPTHPYLIRR